MRPPVNEIPESHGGAGASFIYSVLTVEALSRVDPSIGVFVDVQNTLFINALLKWGTGDPASSVLSQKKHNGSLPLIGVNTFLPKEHAGETSTTVELIRSTDHEKLRQIGNVEAFRPCGTGCCRPVPTERRVRAVASLRSSKRPVNGRIRLPV